jgi:hypothetical protein
MLGARFKARSPQSAEGRVHLLPRPPTLVARAPPPQPQAGKRALATEAQLVAAQAAAAQAAALAGAKRGRTDAEVDATDPGVQVAPGVFKRRVANPYKPAVDGTAAAENISQARGPPARGPEEGALRACAGPSRAQGLRVARRGCGAAYGVAPCPLVFTPRPPPAPHPQGQLDPAAPVPMLEPGPLTGQQQQQQQQQQQDGQGPEGGDGGASAVRGCRHLLPMHAAWFSFVQVHSHEKRALPEFHSSGAAGVTIKARRAPRSAAPRARPGGPAEPLRGRAA